MTRCFSSHLRRLTRRKGQAYRKGAAAPELVPVVRDRDVERSVAVQVGQPGARLFVDRYVDDEIPAAGRSRTMPVDRDDDDDAAATRSS